LIDEIDRATHEIRIKCHAIIPVSCLFINPSNKLTLYIVQQNDNKCQLATISRVIIDVSASLWWIMNHNTLERRNRSQYNVFAIAWLSHLLEFFSCMKLIAQFGIREGGRSSSD